MITCVSPGAARLPQAVDRTQSRGLADAFAMKLLSEHVPLTLLLDLVSAEGPRSEEIMSTEDSDDMSWTVLHV